MRYKLGLPQGRDDQPAKANAPKPPEAKTTEGNNALWRVPSWFPDLDAATLNALSHFHRELLKFNSKVNLISRNTERDADEQHFADCISAAFVLKGKGLSGVLFDFGSGNGLPGVVCAILLPNVRVKLVESDSRKVEFLKHLIAVLKLENAETLLSRIEAVSTDGASSVICRGFANVSKTVLACNRILKSGERIFHMKGSSWSTEIAAMPSQIVSGWAPELVGEYSLPVTQIRRSIVCTTRK